MGGRTAEPASRGEGAAGGPTEAAAGGGDGVDVSLVRWMLSMTPRQRLRLLKSNLRSIRKLRNARARG